MGKNKEKLRAMIRELGEAISITLVQSDNVQVVLKKIKDRGYHVDLSLAIGVGLYREGLGDGSDISHVHEEDVEKELKIFWIAAIIVLIFYGLWLFISYESYYVILGGRLYFAPVAGRMIGGIFIAWLVIMIMFYKKLDNWETIEGLALFTVMANILILIAFILGIIMYKILAVGTIIAMIVNLFFAVLGIHIWIQKRE